MNRRVLQIAVASALARVTPETAPAAPAVRHAAEAATLDKLRVIPVDPGHPREPRPQRFEIDQEQGICYVRRADWPKLQKALKRRRAAQT